MNRIAYIPTVCKDGLKINILIDDAEIEGFGGLAVDMIQVKRSIDKTGAFRCNIFTCYCGILGCADISENMKIF